MHDESFWLRARQEMMLDAASINFNSGTLSPTPKPVFEFVESLRRQQASNPSDFCWRVAPRLLNESRARLAEYLTCRPADLVLLPNVTFAINFAIASLQIPAGSEIVTSDHEYGAMRITLERYAKRVGATVREIRLNPSTEDPAEIISTFNNAITPKTAMVFFSHCLTTTGLLLPAKDIVAALRARNASIIVMIDGAHAPGMIPVALDAIGADFYGANCHKWMMAPAGAGFLHVAAHLKPSVESIITSWGYEYDREKLDDDSLWGGTFWHRDLEFHGTLDRCPQMALGSALDFRNHLGGDNSIAARCRSLTVHAREKLEAAGLRCISPRNESLTGSLVAFDFPCGDPIAMRDTMWNDFHIECPITTGGAKTFLRVSCAWFNTREEIDQLAAAVREIRERVNGNGRGSRTS